VAHWLTVRDADHLLAVLGLGALRAAAQGDDALAAERIRRLREAAALPPPAGDRTRTLPRAGPGEGYAAWAATYDERANRTITLEEPAVASLLAAVPPGRALDVGCGTGRHTARLAQEGHDVVGIDPSPEMLARARERLPDVDFREGDVSALPAADGEAGLVVCALALSHVPSLGAPVAELARVVAPGGLLVVSNIHPLATAVLGWRAWFRRPDGSRAAIPEHPHQASDYVTAFAAAGLRVEACLEPPLPEPSDDGDTEARIVAGLPGVVVWAARRERPQNAAGRA
jgi:SAM-dependent methyltransferase